MNYYLKKGDVKIGAFYWSGIRKKPVLAIERGNCSTKYASFNNEEAAKEFMDFLADFFGVTDRKEISDGNNQE